MYILGHNGCPNPTSTWVSTVTSQQSNLFLTAIYYGAQASYAGCGGPASSDEVGQGGADPTQQGINDAGGGSTPASPNAHDSLTSSGFPLIATVVLDMENYTSSSCDGAVAAYINGWVWQVHNWGGTALVYGSSAIRAMVNLIGNPAQHQPDAIWVACSTDDPTKATYGGNGYDCPGDTTWNLPQVADTYWYYDQRHHQWLINNPSRSQTYGHCESYGGVVTRIDSDTGNGPSSWGYAGWTGGAEAEPSNQQSEDGFNTTGWQSYYGGYGSC